MAQGFGRTQRVIVTEREVYSDAERFMVIAELYCGAEKVGFFFFFVITGELGALLTVIRALLQRSELRFGAQNFL